MTQNPTSGPLFGDREPTFLRDETLAGIFAATAARLPAKDAIRHGDTALDYAELDRRADRVARGLRLRGIGRGCFVGLWMTRSIDLHVALLGILKSGAAYIPFDADVPAGRVATSLADCAARAVLLDTVTGPKLAAVPSGQEERLLLADLPAAGPAGPDEPAGESGPRPDDPAYAIYTSGSTGTPKGIVVSHRNICHYLRAANAVYGLAEDDVVFQGASVAFDLSLEEIFIPYLAGATLWLAGQEVLRETELLPDVLETAGVTVLDTVPTLLAMLPRDPACLRLIILGGEACPPGLVARWSRPGRRLLNSYGPTESTVVATVAELKPGEPVTIGRPIPNYSCYVVDESMALVPDGVRGELLIGGPGVVAGYLGRPELTAAKFIPNPFPSSDGTDPVLYRSGDAVSLSPSGGLEFHGRIDEQVKIRGFRVELGEIEARLAAAPGVARAAVVLRREEACGTGGPDCIDDGVDRLTAFLVAEPDAVLDRAGLRASLRASLPCYMIPTRFELMDDLPRLASGKVDRNGLRTMRLDPAADEPADVEAAAACSATESILVDAARRLFPGQPIGLDDDFFMDLGGHSLLAARFVSLVRQTPALAGITLQDVYDERTPRAIAARLDARAILARAAGETGPRDLSFTPPPLIRRFLCGLAQAAVMPVILALHSASWLGIFMTYMFLSGESDTILETVLPLLGVYTAINLATVAIAVAGKWMVIGRTRPGRYPLWGAYYFRWWLSHRLIGLVHVKWLQGSPLIRLYLRALGTEVGDGAMICDIEAGAVDLVSIGRGATVSGKVAFANAEVIGNELVIGSVSVGDDAYIGTSCVIGHDTRIGEGAELCDLTALAAGSKVGPWERWDGSPARAVGRVAREELPEPPVLGPVRTALAHAAYWLAFAVLPAVTLLPIFPAFYLFEKLETAIDASTGLETELWLPLLSWPTAVALVLATVAFIVAVRWIVLPRVRSGSYPVDGGFYVRKWIVALATELTLETLTSLFATVYMRHWYRLMGAKIGKDAEISTNLAGRYDLTEIGEKCFIADEVVLGDEDIRRGWMTLKPVRTAAKVFIGNDAVVPPGADIPTGALIGIKSKPPTDRQVEAGETWFGSPPIRLPVRQRFDDVASAWTYEPSRKRRLARAAFEACTVSFPIMLQITFGTLCVDALEPYATAGDYGSFFLLFAAQSVGVALALTLVSVAVKWLLMGVYKPIAKPMWSWWAMRTEAVAVMYWGMAGKALLEHLRGTPMLPWLLRLFGCKTGKGVYLDTTDVTEFDCVRIGDYTALNSVSALQTHLYEDRVMKVGRVEVGTGVTVGSMATVLYDTHVGDFARLGPLTLVMKGETIPAHSDWSGAPAAPTVAPAPAWTTAPAPAALPEVVPCETQVEALSPAA